MGPDAVTQTPAWRPRPLANGTWEFHVLPCTATYLHKQAHKPEATEPLHGPLQLVCAVDVMSAPYTHADPTTAPHSCHTRE